MEQNASTAKVTISQILFADIYLDAAPDTCDASQFTHLCCHNPCCLLCFALDFYVEVFPLPVFLSSLPVFSSYFLSLLVSFFGYHCVLP